MEESQVQKFYKSCNVFITGGTGFLGRVLIEKLLRSTEVSTVYVMIREKKGKNIHTRIDELVDDVIFDRLRRECPKFKYRIEVIPGDCSVTGLGLSISDRQKLISDIHVVFHVAATVRFDENLKLAYAINVNGTRNILEIAKQMKHLKSLIHVSTAYSNCHLKEIEEKFYDCHIQIDDADAMLQKISKNEAEILTPRIIKPWPNTYTFTKGLAELLVKNTGAGLPVGVFRPSIIISTYKEPIEAWTNNIYSATGVCVGGMSGVLTVALADGNAIADLIPVDTCVAGLIASAWDVGTRECERTPENIPIYNYVSSPENPMTWTEFMELNVIQEAIYPTAKLVPAWNTSPRLTSNYMTYHVLLLFYHVLPGLVMDIGFLIFWQKPRALRMFRKIYKFLGVISYFSLRSWRFTNKNTVNLWLKMNHRDRELFPLSMTTVHWLQYYKKYYRGLRLYILKDTDSTMEMARKRKQRLHMLNKILKIALVFATCNAVSWLGSKIFNSVFG